MNSNRTITVRTPFGELVAPRGFGASYRRAAKAQAALIAAGKPGEVIVPLRDLLSLIGYEVSTVVIAEWSAQQRVEAEVYAASVHLRASDNPIQRHPRPKWLPEPWGGDELNCSPTAIGAGR